MKALIKENNTTLALALPIMTGHLSQMLMGLIDTLMIGRVGTVELAAAAFSNVLFNFPFVFGIGLFVAVSVMVSRAHGAKSDADAAEAYRNGYLMSLILGVLLSLSLLALIPFLGLFQQTAEVTAATPQYLIWLAFSIIPSVPMMTIKNFAEAKNRPWTVLWIMLGGVFLNAALNYLLIFGHFGFPELGLAGAGIATLLARLASWWGLWIYQSRSKILASCRPEKWLRPLDTAICRQALKIGLPVSGQLTMEFGSFAAAALLIGQFGSAALAAHQITISCAGFTFMVPLGISMAVSIRVGHAIGAKEIDRCKRIVIGAQLSSFLAMGLTASAFLFGGSVIANAFTQDPEVIKLTISLLIFAAAFQVFDGAQVISMGALRGLHDVNIPTAMIFVSFWVIGIPSGTLIAFKTDLGAAGLWMGLSIGLGFAAVALTIRLSKRLSSIAKPS